MITCKNINNADLMNLLKHTDACGPSRYWVFSTGYDLATAWRECKNGTWMTWLLSHTEDQPGFPTHRECCEAAMTCIQPIVEKYASKYSEIGRLMKGIEEWREYKHSGQEMRDLLRALYRRRYETPARGRFWRHYHGLSAIYSASYALITGSYQYASAAFVHAGSCLCPGDPRPTPVSKHIAKLVRQYLPITFAETIPCARKLVWIPVFPASPVVIAA